MATIRTAIELQDNFTSVLYQVINSVNLGLSAMEDLHQSMNAQVDTSSIEAARDSINQATIAVQELDAAMQGIETPTTNSPTAPESSAPVQLPVEPVVPDPLVEPQEPVQVPIVWQSDNMEVFTGTGVERFEQEVQSANNMLNTLNTTQERIASTAAQTNLFPESAVADMGRMESRLQAIQQRIQQIENNPLNIGTETANAELERLRGQLDQAVQEQENLNRAVADMDVQAANEAYLRLSQTIGNTERYIRDNVDEQGRFNQEINEGAANADNLMNAIKGAVAAYATVQTVGKALDLSDTLTSTTARLNLMNDGLQTTQDLQNMIYLSAERARGSYQATANAVSKLGLMAGDAFGSSEEIVAFMEQINKQFTIAGTEAAGIDAAMLQLTQAMGSGVLRGEEYNSILEQAPNIIQAIADYMEVPKGQLKDMAADGAITADIVKAAMFDLEMFGQVDELDYIIESMIPCNMIVISRNEIPCKASGFALFSGGICFVQDFFITNDFRESYTVNSKAAFGGGMVEEAHYFITNDSKENIAVNGAAVHGGGAVNTAVVVITNDFNEQFNINGENSAGSGVVVSEFIGTNQ